MPFFTDFVLYAAPVFAATFTAAYVLNRKRTADKVQDIIKDMRDNERLSKITAKKNSSILAVIDEPEDTVLQAVYQAANPPQPATKREAAPTRTANARKASAPTGKPQQGELPLADRPPQRPPAFVEEELDEVTLQMLQSSSLAYQEY